MSSAEEDNALLRQSQEIGVRESEIGEESVVESVVRGRDGVDDGGEEDGNNEAGDVDNQLESEETGGHEASDTVVPGFGEKDVLSDDDEEEIGSCAVTGSFHSATSEDRHEIDYLANKKGKLF